MTLTLDLNPITSKILSLDLNPEYNMYDPHLGPNPNTMYDPDFKPRTKPYQKYDPPGPEQLILVYHPNQA